MSLLFFVSMARDKSCPFNETGRWTEPKVTTTRLVSQKVVIKRRKRRRRDIVKRGISWQRILIYRLRQSGIPSTVSSRRAFFAPPRIGTTSDATGYNRTLRKQNRGRFRRSGLSRKRSDDSSQMAPG